MLITSCVLFLVVVLVATLAFRSRGDDLWVRKGVPMGEKVKKTDEEWRKLLTEEQFRVARGHGTERAFTGAYWNSKDDGVYLCACCGQPLFDANTKFDSGTGWPSFWRLPTKIMSLSKMIEV